MNEEYRPFGLVIGYVEGALKGTSLAVASTAEAPDYSSDDDAKNRDGKAATIYSNLITGIAEPSDYTEEELYSAMSWYLRCVLSRIIPILQDQVKKLSYTELSAPLDLILGLGELWMFISELEVLRRDIRNALTGEVGKVKWDLSMEEFEVLFERIKQANATIKSNETIEAIRKWLRQVA